MELAYLIVVLFLIMDPVGNIPSFLDLMRPIPPKKRLLIIVREMLIALTAMALCYFLGELVFNLLQVSETTIRITSGAILFLVAIKILFPATDSLRANLPQGEPFITPLAIPLIAGPSLLATIMLFAKLEKSHSTMLGAIFVAWLCSLMILFCAPRIHRFLGVNGLMACERLMALTLAMLAIQRFLEGVRHFIQTCQM